MQVRKFVKLYSMEEKLIITEFWIDPKEGSEREALSKLEKIVKEFCATSTQNPTRYTKDSDPFRRVVIEEIKQNDQS